MSYKRSPDSKHHQFTQLQLLTVKGVAGVWHYYTRVSKRRVVLEPANEAAKRVAEPYPYGMIHVSAADCSPYNPDRSVLRAHQESRVQRP